MIVLLPTLALLFAPALDDAQARELLAALRKSWEAAETRSMDYSAGAAGAERNEVYVSGSIRLKGQDRWAISLKSEVKRLTDGSTSMTITSDGARVVGQGRAADLGLEPKATAV